MAKIELKAFHGKQQGPFTACPVYDTNKGKLLGVKKMSPDEAFKHPRPVDADTSRKIVDGLVLDLDDIVDATDWEWIKHNKEIDNSWEEANNNPNALYYVFEPDQELEKRVKKKELVFDALTIVHNASKTTREEIMRLLGTNVSEYGSKEILDLLIDKAEKQPEKVLEVFKDEYKEQKLFLYGLLDNRMIKKDSNGTYRYGDIVMGLNMMSAINWLANNDNREIVGRLYAQLNRNKVSIDAPVGSFMEELKEEARRKSEQQTAVLDLDTGGSDGESN